MLSTHESLNLAESLLQQKDKKLRFNARQLLFLNSPLSKLVELYLYNNEGQPQKLDKFPLMVPIYDNLPKKLLLKCSRKTLKSTLISNIIVLNLIRYNNYHMMYVSPDEAGTKKFSHDYLSARFVSPPIQKIISKLSTNDVFSKKVKESDSSIQLTYASDDPNRTRGPSMHSVVYDEVQGMDMDILPIIAETMTILKLDREIFAGTPMTTDNAIHKLWKRSNQMEWATKCDSCNHWNTLTEDNEPMRMIQKKGLCCSKCGDLLHTQNGLWVDFNPGDREITGYHMAQPLLPFYNEKAGDWNKIYQKCYERDYSLLQVYNEVLGLSYDAGAKPVTEAHLKTLCDLGPMAEIFRKNRHRYLDLFMGVDWGVNPHTSRTVGTIGGIREDGVIEIFYIKIFKNTDYEAQIKELAKVAKAFRPFLAADSGPDPLRGKLLGNLYNPELTQLVSYRESLFTQYTDAPVGMTDWSQKRWCLHRSDTMGFTMNLLKKGMIRFPRWDDSSEAMQDILSIFTEIKEDALKAKLFYRHGEPDDFFHTLNYIVCQAHLRAGNVFFLGPSSNGDSEQS